MVYLKIKGFCVFAYEGQIELFLSQKSTANIRFNRKSVKVQFIRLQCLGIDSIL